jgi:hypothetical protein
MPYVAKKVRELLDADIEMLFDSLQGPTRGSDIHPGLFNYAFSKILHSYITERGGPNYRLLNELIGMLECCKLELYRQIAAKYEDQKKRENGAVSELDAINLEDVR